MRKLATLTIGFLISTTALFAQDSIVKPVKAKYYIPKYTKFLSGNLNVGFGKANNSAPINSQNVSSGVTERSGVFLANNLVLGVNIGYAFAYSKTASNIGPNFYQKWYSHRISPGVFLRYYKMFSPKFGLFGQFNGVVNLEYDIVRSNTSISNNKDERIGFEASISPGLVYFITPKVALEAAIGNLGYSYMKDINSSNAVHNAGLVLNPNLNIGLSFYFGKGVQIKL